MRYRTQVEGNTFRSQLISCEWGEGSKDFRLCAGADMICRRKKVERVLRLEWCLLVKARTVFPKWRNKGGDTRVWEMVKG